MKDAENMSEEKALPPEETLKKILAALQSETEETCL